MKRRTKLMIIGGASVLALAAGVLVWTVTHQRSAPSTSEAAARLSAKGKELLAADPATLGMDTFIDQYGPTYDSIDTKDASSRMDSWTRDDVDALYYRMAYADAIGLSSEVSTISAQLAAAKRAGIDIDDNSFGIDQAKRDALRSRAEMRQQAAMEGAAQ